jgi:NodT family efflux transporter outer membrane factor (OMF) lipoprotein
VFEDPVLDRLIRRAASSNLDVREAAARIRQSRAQLAGARSRGYPTLALGAVAGGGQWSDNGALAQVAPSGGFDPQAQFAIGLVANWELDLFGRVRSSVRAAEAGVQASVEDQRNVYVVLFGEVAMTYAEARTLQQRIEDTQANVALQRGTLELVEQRIAAGVSTQLDAAQAEMNLFLTRAAVPPLEISLRLAFNRLAVLLGEQAGALDAELSTAASIPVPPPEVAIGIPADLLRRRPDVRAAERRYESEQARIGAATADLYPQLSIGGYFGIESRDLSSLFDADSREWRASAPIGWVAFDGGGLRSRVDAADARTDAALLQYEQVVLEALAETENALVEYAQQTTRREQLAAAVAAAQRAVELVLIQYRDGTVDFQNVMDSQRELLGAQDDLAHTEGRVATALIGIYKSLGGGWQSVTPGQEGS